MTDLDAVCFSVSFLPNADGDIRWGRPSSVWKVHGLWVHLNLRHSMNLERLYFSPAGEKLLERGIGGVGERTIVCVYVCMCDWHLCVRCRR